MKQELLLSQKKEVGLNLDPRTKLALLVAMAVFILTGAYQTPMHYILAAVPFILLIMAHKWGNALLYALLFCGGLSLEQFALPHLSGVPGYLIVAAANILLHFLPGIVMGYFVVTTTTVSEFVAAMERLHLPKQITIPMSVMFRFFPTVMEEWGAIGDAMHMRGIKWRGSKASVMLEYRLVPMMMCSVKIGEELSAASLTRGLGGPVKRTNICKIGFHIQDILLLLLCLSILAAQIFSVFGGLNL
ncbi:MAG: energy-coupling factor transporter transmembrane component T [Muricomes sp.]